MKKLFLIGFIFGALTIFNIQCPEIDIDEVDTIPTVVLAYGMGY